MCLMRSMIVSFLTVVIVCSCRKEEVITPTPTSKAEIASDDSLTKAVECVMKGIPSFPGASNFVAIITNRYFPLTPGRSLSINLRRKKVLKLMLSK